MANPLQGKLLGILALIELACTITCLALNREYEVANAVSQDILCLSWIGATYVVISAVVLLLNFVEAEQMRQSWLLPVLFAVGSAIYVVLGITFSNHASSVQRQRDLLVLGMSEARYNAYMSFLVLSFAAGVAYGIDALLRILAKIRS